MKADSGYTRDLAFAAALLILTFAAYFPALHGGMIWDDDRHVTMPALRSLHGLERIWFDLGATQQYYPLLHTAFWIEHRLWGDNVLGYHVVTLVLHVTAALLLVAIMRKLGMKTAAWPAGFFFALHPMSVEAVAWISEQKSTLSAVFYLASALIYLDFDRTRKHWQYLLALTFFVLALMSKSVTATLPAALLLVLWWQRGRLGWRRDVAPLIPWLCLGAAAGLFTAWVERTVVGADGAEYVLTALQRVMLAGRVAWFYLSKLVFPVNLMFFYPHWNIDTSQWWQYAFTLGLLTLVAIAAWLARTRRGPLTAILFFIGTLFPVLGFLNVYPFVYSYVADHFAYLAGLGVIIPVAVFASRSPYASALLIAPLVVLTWREAHLYRDVETLYTESLQRNPESWISHDNLGVALLDQPGHIAEAADHFRQALQINPDAARAHSNLGSAYVRLNRIPDAIGEFQTAVRLRPNFPLALNNLGEVLLRFPGRSMEAMGYFREAIRLEPGFADPHNNLGRALSQTGGMNEAMHEFETALTIKPDSAEAHSNLGSALIASGRLPEAVDHLQTAVRLNPRLAEAHTNLGLAYSKLPGRVPEAIAQFREALNLDPNQADAHNDLAIALAQTGQRSESIAQFEQAVRAQPDSLQMRINLGNALLDTPGRLQDAITQFRAAVRMGADSFPAHFLLGLALLRVPGNGNEALSQLEAALAIKPDPDVQKIVTEMRHKSH